MPAGPLPSAAHPHLHVAVNRCLLILLGSTQLDEEDCWENLLLYGSINFIQLTPDRRAAFVDFACEHAPLLVARCFAYYKTNPDVRMPKGISTLLPGCSVGNFLYLLVPPSLSTLALQKYFHAWCGHEVTVFRTVTLAPSSRVVVHLRMPAEGFTHQKTFESHVEAKMLVNGELHTFHAVPTIPQLIDFSAICESEGCEECNVVSLRPYMEQEENRVERESPPTLAEVPTHNTTSTVSPPLPLRDRVVFRQHSGDARLTFCIEIPEEMDYGKVRSVPRRFRCTTIPAEERWDDVPEPPTIGPLRVEPEENGDQESSPPVDNVFLSPDLPRFQDGEQWNDVPQPSTPVSRKKTRPEKEPSPPPSSPSWMQALPFTFSSIFRRKNDATEPSTPISERDQGEKEERDYGSQVDSMQRQAKREESPNENGVIEKNGETGEGSSGEGQEALQRAVNALGSGETGQGSTEGELEALQRAVNAPGSGQTGQESGETEEVGAMPQGMDEVQERRDERGTEALSSAPPIFRWNRKSVLDHEEEDYRSIEKELLIGNEGNTTADTSDEDKDSMERASSTCPGVILEARTSEKEEDEVEVEQRDDVPSLVSPIHLLRRASGVDSDDEVALEMEERGGKEEENEDALEEEQRDTQPAICPILTGATEKTGDVIVEELERDEKEYVVVEEEDRENLVNRNGEMEQESPSSLISACEVAVEASDVIVEESESLAEKKEEELVVEETEETEEMENSEPQPALISACEMAVEASDVIVEESESLVDEKEEEEVVVEEKVENEEREEESNESTIHPIVSSDSKISAVDEAQSSMYYESVRASPIISLNEKEEGYKMDSDDLLAGEEDQWKSESDRAISIVSLNEKEEGDEMDSDDLLSGEEDQWRSVCPRSISRFSGVSTVDLSIDAEDEEKDYEVAPDGAPPLVMTMEEEETMKAIVREIFDRAVEAMIIPSPTVSLKNEDTESSRFSDGSFEDTVDYGIPSEDSTLSDASSDTVVAEGDQKSFVDLDDWDEADRVKYGYRRNVLLSTIEEEEDIFPPPAPMPHWIRTSVIDQEEDEEDYLSSESEYHDWLTREDPKDSQRCGSSNSVKSMVPLPSTLATTSWGTGIVPEEKTTVDA